MEIVKTYAEYVSKQLTGQKPVGCFVYQKI